MYITRRPSDLHFFVLIGCVWSYSCRGYRCKQGNMIDHEGISIQGVIGRVFQIGRTRIFLFIYIVNARVYVERRTKKRPEFRIGILDTLHELSEILVPDSQNESTASSAHCFFFFKCLVFILPASQQTL